MKVHHITVTAYSSREAAAGLRETLKGILPADTPIEENVIEPETEGAVFTKEMVELSSRLTKNAQMREFASKVLGGLDDYDKRNLRERLSDRVDEECNLYLRLSKAEAAAGRMVVEYKDPVHVTFKLAAYPANRENALKSASELLDEMF